MKAIRVHTPGGPDALQLEDVPEPEAGPGEAVVRMEATGVNYIEVYQRKGLYPLQTPFTPGAEGAGTVVAVGEGVATPSPTATTVPAPSAPGVKGVWSGYSPLRW